MESDNNVIRTIRWRELFPWTLIFRSLPVAVSVPVMVLAFIGVVATPVGWKISQWVFVNQEKISASDPAFADFITHAGSPYRGILGSSPGESLVTPIGVRNSGPEIVFVRFVEPFWRMFRQYSGLGPFLYLLLGGVWTMVVWSLIGMAITRIAVIRYTRNESVGLNEAVRFSRDRFASCMTGLVIPLVGVFALCIVTFVAGLFMTFDVGLFVVSLFYFVILALAGVMAVILLGLAFGWPLTIAAISTEGQDSFDAMTRSFAYTFQRPLNYAFYALVAIVFGGLCWLLVARVTEGIENLSYWSTSWGANIGQFDRMENIRDPATIPAVVPVKAVATQAASTTSAAGSGIFRASRSVIGFWTSLLKSVAVAFLYAQFWCLAAAVYLLLRRDVDETELDEVFVSEEQRTYDLPALATPPGTPQVSTPASPGEADTRVHKDDDGN